MLKKSLLQTINRKLALNQKWLMQSQNQQMLKKRKLNHQQMSSHKKLKLILNQKSRMRKIRRVKKLLQRKQQRIQVITILYCLVPMIFQNLTENLNMEGQKEESHITSTHNMVMIIGFVGRVIEMDFGTVGLEVVLLSLLLIRLFHL